MKVSLVNYATKEYHRKKKYNSFSARYFGHINKVYSFLPEDIEHDFREKNKNILSQKKGAGLWLWKPYFFNKVLNESINEGDYLFHCDASSFFIRSVKPLIKLMKKNDIDIMCFSLPLLEKEWTSPLVFDYFKASEAKKNSNQILANFLLVKKTERALYFAKEWLDICSNEDILTGLKNKHHETLNFHEQHRFDQSILSMLCKKYNIIPFRDPSQYGELPEMYRFKKGFMKCEYNYSNYKTIIILIRKTSLGREFIVFNVKKFLKKFFPNIYIRTINKYHS